MTSSGAVNIAHPVSVPILSPPAAVKAIEPFIQARKQFRALIEGAPLTGRTETLALLATRTADLWGIAVAQIAILAPSDVAAHLLCRRIVSLINPAAELEDVFFDDMAGSIAEVAYAHSEEWPRFTTSHERAMVNEFIVKLSRVAGTVDKKFLRARRSDVSRTLALIRTARNQAQELPEHYRTAIERGRQLPALGMVMEIADTYEDFKRREHLVDGTDVLRGRLLPVNDCPLVLIDEAHNVTPVAEHAALRLFPNAAVVIAGDVNAGMCERWQDAPRVMLEQRPVK